MKTIYLLRHAQTDWNKQGIVQGKQDISINAEGRAEAEKAKQYFETCNVVFDNIYTSTLKRTIQTAEIITGKSSDSFSKEKQLDERALGEWEKQKREVVKKKEQAASLPFNAKWWRKLRRLQTTNNDEFQRHCKRCKRQHNYTCCDSCWLTAHHTQRSV